MRGTGEYFGSCNFQPKGAGSNKPRGQMHLSTCWIIFFARNPYRTCRPPNLTENRWSLHEFECAVRRMKIFKRDHLTSGPLQTSVCCIKKMAFMIQNARSIAGNTSAGRTTRLPKTAAVGWTLAECNIIVGQGFGQANSSLGCASGSAKNFGQGELECIVVCVGTDGLINIWNTIVAKCGQRNIDPNIGNCCFT